MSKMEFLARLLGVEWKAPTLEPEEKPNGAVGGYCRGKSLDECKRIFGNKIEEVCSTCPE